jgi:hypothetical protein
LAISYPKLSSYILFINSLFDWGTKNCYFQENLTITTWNKSSMLGIIQTPWNYQNLFVFLIFASGNIITPNQDFIINQRSSFYQNHWVLNSEINLNSLISYNIWNSSKPEWNWAISSKLCSLFQFSMLIKNIGHYWLSYH